MPPPSLTTSHLHHSQSAPAWTVTSAYVGTLRLRVPLGTAAAAAAAAATTTTSGGGASATAAVLDGAALEVDELLVTLAPRVCCGGGGGGGERSPSPSPPPPDPPPGDGYAHQPFPLPADPASTAAVAAGVSAVAAALDGAAARARLALTRCVVRVELPPAPGAPDGVAVTLRIGQLSYGAAGEGGGAGTASPPAPHASSSLPPPRPPPPTASRALRKAITFSGLALEIDDGEKGGSDGDGGAAATTPSRACLVLCGGAGHVQGGGEEDGEGGEETTTSNSSTTTDGVSGRLDLTLTWPPPLPLPDPRFGTGVEKDGSWGDGGAWRASGRRPPPQPRPRLDGRLALSPTALRLGARSLGLVAAAVAGMVGRGHAIAPSPPPSPRAPTPDDPPESLLPSAAAAVLAPTTLPLAAEVVARSWAWASYHDGVGDLATAAESSDGEDAFFDARSSLASSVASLAEAAAAAAAGAGGLSSPTLSLQTMPPPHAARTAAALEATVSGAMAEDDEEEAAGLPVPPPAAPAGGWRLDVSAGPGAAVLWYDEPPPDPRPGWPAAPPPAATWRPWLPPSARPRLELRWGVAVAVVAADKDGGGRGAALAASSCHRPTILAVDVDVRGLVATEHAPVEGGSSSSSTSRLAADLAATPGALPPLPGGRTRPGAAAAVGHGCGPAPVPQPPTSARPIAVAALSAVTAGGPAAPGAAPPLSSWPVLAVGGGRDSSLELTLRLPLRGHASAATATATPTRMAARAQAMTLWLGLPFAGRVAAAVAPLIMGEAAAAAAATGGGTHPAAAPSPPPLPPLPPVAASIFLPHVCLVFILPEGECGGEGHGCAPTPPPTHGHRLLAVDLAGPAGPTPTAFFERAPAGGAGALDGRVTVGAASAFLLGDPPGLPPCEDTESPTPTNSSSRPRHCRRPPRPRSSWT